MRIVSEGLKYDTETAKPVVTYTHGVDTHIEETMFVTPNGRWFLLKMECPKSKKRRKPENTHHWIQPKSQEKAFNWFESRGYYSLLEEHFSSMIAEA